MEPKKVTINYALLCKQLEKQGKTKEKFSAEASLLSAIWQRTRNRQKILKEPCVYFSGLSREVW